MADGASPFPPGANADANSPLPVPAAARCVALLAVHHYLAAAAVGVGCLAVSLGGVKLPELWAVELNTRLGDWHHVATGGGLQEKKVIEKESRVDAKQHTQA